LAENKAKENRRLPALEMEDEKEGVRERYDRLLE
jgi:hypothetical protein